MESDYTQLDAVQGASEERNEPYKRYGEASTAARQRSNAPIATSANSCAVWQGGGA
jgi:hypothetical protein